MTSKSTSLPSSIEGVSRKHAISELWKSHFGRLLNVIQDYGLCDISCDTGYSDDIPVGTNEVVLAVQALGANKASGLDGIVAEHLLYGSERWCTMLAMCLSGLFVLCLLCACLACLYMGFYLTVCLRSYSFQLSKTKLEELIELITTDQLL